MILKNFRSKVTLRVIVITILAFCLSWLILETRLYATMLIAAAVIIYQIAMLIKLVDKTNQDLQRFFDAIKYADFSQHFGNTGLGSSFDGLKSAFSDVVTVFQKARAEKEENFRYLQTVVQHVGIGLIAFDAEGKVELINNAAKRLLRLSHLREISDLNNRSEKLVEILQTLGTGQKALTKIYDEEDILHFIIYATEFSLRGRQIKLVSLQNIQSELEEKEMEAWQKMIRVLTHEIMNSVTPISSLAGTVSGIIQKQSSDSEGQPAYLSDIRTALDTIERRSNGLIRFVETYRSLTKIPRPNFQIVLLGPLVERLMTLVQGQVDPQKVTIVHTIEPESLEVTADPDLLEQVLLNLLINALQAFRGGSGLVQLNCGIDKHGRIFIRISDNGPGISPEVREKIFIPFFTTKKEGSGIGLSLCRQIMRMHRGSIAVHSEIGQGTTFTLRF